MEKLTHEIRKKIETYRKNKVDISELIKGRDISNEDLSGCIIKDFNRIKEIWNNVKLSGASIGEVGRVTNISSNKMFNCEFTGTKFLGTVFFRRNKCRNNNFEGAWCPKMEWQYTDLTGCNFCEATLTLGTEYFYKAIVDENIFRDLTKYLNIKVTMKEPETNEEIEKKLSWDIK